MEERMGRGFHDEMGGPDSIASPSEWGPLSFGDSGMTAAGLPASPGVAPSALPSAISYDERGAASVKMRDLPSQWRGLGPDGLQEMLRHNFLLRRSLSDPGYGAVRAISWREKAANGLGVASVPPAPPPYVPGGPFGI